MLQYLYRNSFGSFLEANPDEILGKLVGNYHGETKTTTITAWKEEISILQDVLKPWRDEDAEIIFEYRIPRLGKRIDVVLLLRGIIFCLEFKVGREDIQKADVDQVWDYALDLKNFHLYSRDRYIVPILIPSEHQSITSSSHIKPYEDKVISPMVVGSKQLQTLIDSVTSKHHEDGAAWTGVWHKSPYSPTPTIIEAARELYENHSVEEITRHEADKVTTDATIAEILGIINKSKADRRKSICFVTGVPGAGKTLVGLDIAVKQSYNSNGEFNAADGAVYLSGNGPLVAVLREALVRNKLKNNLTVTKDDAQREVGKFIQNIHTYRDNMLAKIKNPIVGGKIDIDPEKAVNQKDSGYAEVEHFAIFDEAQRSWTQKHLAQYLKRGGTYGNKLKIDNFPISEAAFLIWSLDQRQDWATIVCLVGDGQEINTGEGGITEWIKALNSSFIEWDIYISKELTSPGYVEGDVKKLLSGRKGVYYCDNLHLSVSLRSFRSECLSAFVHSMLTLGEDAEKLYKKVVSKGYPIVLTRSVDAARNWIRQHARGSEQSGLLLTKTSARYKAIGVNLLERGDDNAVHWFLDGNFDVRSSNYLEVAATEIQVQGLELDYTCVIWDADMRFEQNGWGYWKFGASRWSPNCPTKSKWIPENNQDVQRYMLNAYRVLLTRARQGMVICVPEGDSRETSEGYFADSTRAPEFYDATYNYLKSIGIEEI